MIILEFETGFIFFWTRPLESNTSIKWSWNSEDKVDEECWRIMSAGQLRTWIRWTENHRKSWNIISRNYPLKRRGQSWQRMWLNRGSRTWAHRASCTGGLKNGQSWRRMLTNDVGRSVEDLNQVNWNHRKSWNMISRNCPLKNEDKVDKEFANVHLQFSIDESACKSTGGRPWIKDVLHGSQALVFMFTLTIARISWLRPHSEKQITVWANHIKDEMNLHQSFLVLRTYLCSTSLRGYKYTLPKVQSSQHRFFCWKGCPKIIGWFNIQGPDYNIKCAKLSANIAIL